MLHLLYVYYTEQKNLVSLSSNNFTLKVSKFCLIFNTRYLVNSLYEISTKFNVERASSIQCQKSKFLLLTTFSAYSRTVWLFIKVCTLSDKLNYAGVVCLQNV